MVLDTSKHYNIDTMLIEEARTRGVFIRGATRRLIAYCIAKHAQASQRPLLTPVSDPPFHALSHGSLSFALHGSFFNRFLIGQNSSTTNQNL